MAAPQGDYGGTAELTAYHRAGFSVIPVSDDKRPSELLPGRSWKAYQRTRASGQEIVNWYRMGARGWAIVCGQPSEVYGLDGDHEGFNQWLLSGVVDNLMRNTWVVKTGCQGVHTYLKSKIPVVSHILTVDGIKLADVRGDGQGDAGPSYLVAPPTFIRCPKHGLEGNYETIYGSPESVLQVENALAVFQRLGALYVGSTAPRIYTTGAADNRRISPESQGPVPRHSPDIPPPLSPKAKIALERKVENSTLSRKVKRTLLKGAVAGDADWPDAGADNSYVDWAVTCALIRSRFSDEEIADCFTTLHAGDFTFKNPGRPQHGMRYLLDYTLPRARVRVAEQEAALQDASGPNFRVTEVVRVPFDEIPLWCLTILLLPSEREIKVRLKASDFESDRAFKRAVWNKSEFMPELQGGHMGANGFQIFMGVLGRMTQTADDLPDDASEAGYARSMILSTLRGAGVRHGVSDPNANSIGWIQGDWVVVRPEVLTSRMKSAMRVSVPQLWEAFQHLGGHAEPMRIDGRLENLWLLPVKKVGFLED